MNTIENDSDKLADLGGKWSGKIKTGTKESEMQAYFTTGRINSAAISLPEHDVKSLPLVNANYNPPKVHFEYVTRNVRGIFDGTLSNNCITGSFNQNGETGSFEITKDTEDQINQ